MHPTWKRPKDADEARKMIAACQAKAQTERHPNHRTSTQKDPKRESQRIRAIQIKNAHQLHLANGNDLATCDPYAEGWTTHDLQEFLDAKNRCRHCYRRHHQEEGR